MFFTWNKTNEINFAFLKPLYNGKMSILISTPIQISIMIHDWTKHLIKIFISIPGNSTWFGCWTKCHVIEVWQLPD